jgi:hypothetical protein
MRLICDGHFEPVKLVRKLRRYLVGADEYFDVIETDHIVALAQYLDLFLDDQVIAFQPFLDLGQPYILQCTRTDDQQGPLFYVLQGTGE